MQLVGRIAFHRLEEGLELLRRPRFVLFQDLLEFVDRARVVALDEPRLTAVAAVEIVLELPMVKGQVLIVGIAQVSPREFAVLVVFELAHGHLGGSQRREPDPASGARVAVIAVPVPVTAAFALGRLATAPVGLPVLFDGRLVTASRLTGLVFVRAEREIVRISTLTISGLLRIPLDARGIFRFAGSLCGYVRWLHLTAKRVV